ncbi:hypothetical protein PanWU01x14_321000 [Parasponia andersonii]|uniref:Uncharacterized protein n=1 Tax=Parasponia andersonii TaxID=3476 RepID=A0A2P5ALB2_PARAD|nr:hypothetical protein PanWU01x14_321000 [Parasponia andersonii]
MAAVLLKVNLTIWSYTQLASSTLFNPLLNSSILHLFLAFELASSVIRFTPSMYVSSVPIAKAK